MAWRAGQREGAGAARARAASPKRQRSEGPQGGGELSQIVRNGGGGSNGSQVRTRGNADLAAEVQQLLAKPIGLEDLWPKHLMRWARPVSHMLLPVVLPLRCEGCGGAGGKLMRCARCRLVHYCSRACQLAHHGTHGPACRRIVRAVRQMQESDAQLVSAPAQHAPANRRPCS